MAELQGTFDDRDGWIWHDGEMVPWRDARVHVLTHALHYASSVFEGQRAYHGEIFKLAEHSERLRKSAPRLALAADGGQLRTRVLRLVGAEPRRRGVSSFAVGLFFAAAFFTTVACTRAVLSQRGNENARASQPATAGNIADSRGAEDASSIASETLPPGVASLIAEDDVAGEDAGLASGLFNTSQQVGGSLGLAVLALPTSANSLSTETGTSWAGSAGVRFKLLRKSESLRAWNRSEGFILMASSKCLRESSTRPVKQSRAANP